MQRLNITIIYDLYVCTQMPTQYMILLQLQLFGVLKVDVVPRTFKKVLSKKDFPFHCLGIFKVEHPNNT